MIFEIFWDFSRLSDFSTIFDNFWIFLVVFGFFGFFFGFFMIFFIFLDFFNFFDFLDFFGFFEIFPEFRIFWPFLKFFDFLGFFFIFCSFLDIYIFFFLDFWDFHTKFRPSFVLRHAQGTPPGFWNGMDWRALVESRPPNIGKLRGKHFFFWQKKYIFKIIRCFEKKGFF